MVEEKKRHGRVQLHLMDKITIPQNDIKEDRSSFIMTPINVGLALNSNEAGSNGLDLMSPLKKPDLDDTNANMKNSSHYHRFKRHSLGYQSQGPHIYGNPSGNSAQSNALGTQMRVDEAG